MTRPLTERQEQVLHYIASYVVDYGYAPSQREIMRRFKIKSTKGVARHLEALEKKGHLTRTYKGARALEVHGLYQCRGIPIVGRVAAGQPILAEENLEGTLALDGKLARWKEAFFLKVKGDSMIEAGILDGDYVLVRPQASAEHGDTVAAMIDNEATVKRFVKKNERILLEAANPAYAPIEITENSGELRIIGKVMTVIRSLAGPLT